jgi:hypothetical protein
MRCLVCLYAAISLCADSRCAPAADTVASIWPAANAAVPAALLRIGVMGVTIGINVWGDYAMAFVRPGGQV